jgi:hypothetical protein
MATVIDDKRLNDKDEDDDNGSADCERNVVSEEGPE